MRAAMLVFILSLTGCARYTIYQDHDPAFPSGSFVYRFDTWTGHQCLLQAPIEYGLQLKNMDAENWCDGPRRKVGAK